jgi:hypothetical protein
VRRPLALIAVNLAFVVLSLTVVACGGSDDEETTTNTPAPGVEGPRGAPPSSAPTGFPPEFVQCMADKGVDVSSQDAIHADQQAFSECLPYLHGS